MTFRRIYLYALPTVAVIALAAVFAGRLATLDDGTDVPPSARLDQPMPAIQLDSLYPDGPALDTEKLRGAPYVLNVWAEWCGPCKIEHPQLLAMSQQGIPVYGVNYKDRPELARAFLAERGDPFRAIGADQDGRTGIELGIFGVPETFLVDREGFIRHRHAGPLSEDDLERVFFPFLAHLQEPES